MLTRLTAACSHGWMARGIVILGLTQGAAFVLAYIFRLDPRVGTLVTPLPLEINLIQVLGFGTMGCLLAFAHRGDDRAAALGGFLAIMSGIYGQGKLAQLPPTGGMQLLFKALGTLEISTFLAFFFLLFATRFPHVPVPFAMRRWQRRGLGFLALVATGLLLVSLIDAVHVLLPLPWTRSLGTRDYGWLVAGPALLAATVLLAWKRRWARGDERRRSQLFILALVIALGPVTVDTICEAFIPPYASFLKTNPTLHLTRNVVANLFILTIPFITAHAVLVQRALDVRLIARKALQHALARWSARLALTAPFVLLCFFLYQQRRSTLEDLFSGGQVIWLLALTLAGLFTNGFRHRILDAIDRQFFRDRYNARRVLTQLAEQVRGTRNFRELANLVDRGVDLALHLERVALLVEDPTVGLLVDPKGEMRPLDPTDRLVQVTQNNRAPMDIDLASSRIPFTELDETERHWLADQRVQLLVPIFALDGSMNGLLVVGPKRSELPFLGEDRQLLTNVCSAVGLVIELLRLKERSSVLPETVHEDDTEPMVAIDPDTAQRPARECMACHRLYPSDAETCPNCEVELKRAAVPYVLRRSFRLERRIGTGGMAVVYRAKDLKLGRNVAVKTLPRVSPEAAIRLQREARTVASVTHPGLAAIYGIETWEGTPMLILELLGGGTLADRMADGPLSTETVLATGRAVALALARIHRQGILHRDVKPSNIGFTRDDQPKLLDFGIAHIRNDLRPEVPDNGDPALQDPGNDATRWQEVHTSQGPIAGTLTYLSPEAVQRQEPHPTFDLWSLSVVLYEALIGENLFFGNIGHVLDAIRNHRIPDLREQLPGCPDPLAEFFVQELHPQRSQRSQDGMEMNQRLGELAERLDDLRLAQERLESPAKRWT